MIYNIIYIIYNIYYIYILVLGWLFRQSLFEAPFCFIVARDLKPSIVSGLTTF